MQNWENICQIFSSRHLNKVIGSFRLFFKQEEFFFKILTFLAIKESCDWFVENYETARK